MLASKESEICALEDVCEAYPLLASAGEKVSGVDLHTWLEEGARIGGKPFPSAQKVEKLRANERARLTETLTKRTKFKTSVNTLQGWYGSTSSSSISSSSSKMAMEMLVTRFNQMTKRIWFGREREGKEDGEEKGTEEIEE